MSVLPKPGKGCESSLDLEMQWISRCIYLICIIELYGVRKAIMLISPNRILFSGRPPQNKLNPNTWLALRDINSPNIKNILNSAVVQSVEETYHSYILHTRSLIHSIIGLVVKSTGKINILSIYPQFAYPPITKRSASAPHMHWFIYKSTHIKLLQNICMYNSRYSNKQGVQEFTCIDSWVELCLFFWCTKSCLEIKHFHNI